ncbi:MAG: hypothetical protein LBC87_05540 [Fibromonadaceae bacterium]|jgi:hypothetical protein|nr:hypothetical protein [Fibromonadaceae bacterium]
MKNIYFAVALVFLVLLAFSACSNGGGSDDSGTSSGGGFRSSSSKGGSSSSTGDDTRSSSSKPSSSSKGGIGSGVCYAPDLMENEDEPEFELPACFEGKTVSVTQADCREIAEDMDATFNFQNSCPAGHKLMCDADELYVYLYGEAIADMTCSDFDLAPVSIQGACYASVDEALGEDYAFCWEPTTNLDCDDYGGTYNVSFKTSCPSGPNLKCNVTDDDGINYYYYGEDAKYVCEEDTEEPEEPDDLNEKKLSKKLSKSLPKKGLLKGFKAKGFSKK